MPLFSCSLQVSFACAADVVRPWLSRYGSHCADDARVLGTTAVTAVAQSKQAMSDKRKTDSTDHSGDERGTGNSGDETIQGDQRELGRNVVDSRLQNMLAILDEAISHSSKASTLS